MGFYYENHENTMTIFCFLDNDNKAFIISYISEITHELSWYKQGFFCLYKTNFTVNHNINHLMFNFDMNISITEFTFINIFRIGKKNKAKKIFYYYEVMKIFMSYKGFIQKG